MSLFKILRGNEATLPPTTDSKDGYTYIVKDKSAWYVDYEDSNGTIQRLNMNQYAEQLRTARSITVDLTSDKTGSFDGTTNITIGVSGALPVSHGGTGATDAATARQNLGIIASGSTAETFTLAASAWSSATSTVNGNAYYTATHTMTVATNEHPIILYGSNGILPSEAERKAYNCLDYVTIDVDTKVLTFYAMSKPTVDLIITVVQS